MAHTTTFARHDLNNTLRVVSSRIAAFFAMLSDASTIRNDLKRIARMSDAQLAARGTERAALVKAIVASRGMY